MRQVLRYFQAPITALAVIAMIVFAGWRGMECVAVARRPPPLHGKQLARELGLREVAVDPVYHGDVFFTYAAPEATDSVTRALRIVELDTRNPFFSLYVDRTLIDRPATRAAALRAVALALAHCPALDGRDELLAALRQPPAVPFPAWSVVDGKLDRWKSDKGYDAWLRLSNGVDWRPLIVGGPTRAPQRDALQIECRG